MKLLALALALSLAVTPAMGQTRACIAPLDSGLSAGDEARLDNLLETRSRGLAQALTSDSAEDRTYVAGLFSRPPVGIATMPDGNYRCRTVKLGGNLPLVVYDWFACAVSGEGSRIEKTSGSQRFSGALSEADGALAYVGASHYSDEAPRPYGADAEHDQVGCLYRVDVAVPLYRLELPAPQFESVHDVIVLEPAD